MNAADRQPVLSRLATLLPSLAEAEPAAQALVLHVRRLVSESLGHLAQGCAAQLPPVEADTLQAALRELPEPDLLLPLLGTAITPAVLLCLELPGKEALAEAMLVHPEISVREQTLDALGGDTAGCEPLAQACQAWARRTLVSVLGRLSGVSHAARLSLQERLLGNAGELLADALPSAGCVPSLEQALLHAEDRVCCQILGERAGVAPTSIETAMAQRDARTLLLFCRKAGCTAAEMLAVQVRLGRIRPDRALRAAPVLQSADALQEGWVSAG